MTRHIDPSKRLVQEFYPGQPQLPIDLLIVTHQRHIRVFIGHADQVDQLCFGKSRYDLDIARFERVAGQPGIGHEPPHRMRGLAAGR